MKALKTISLVLTIIVATTGCYYDVEEELYPSIECQTMEMSYANDILPIIESNCYGCHNTVAKFGNIILEGYSQLLKHVDDGSLLSVIKHSAGFSPMPKNGAKLLECEIEKIEAWVADGALNN